MKKSFRDKVQDALARKHAIVIKGSGKPVRTGQMDVITAEVAFKHFWGKNFKKEIQWSESTDFATGAHVYTGVIYVASWKFTSQGETKHTVMLRLARSFNDTVPLFTASGKEIERQLEE
jgi:hypothetical protein